MAEKANVIVKFMLSARKRRGIYFFRPLYLFNSPLKIQHIG